MSSLSRNNQQTKERQLEKQVRQLSFQLDIEREKVEQSKKAVRVIFEHDLTNSSIVEILRDMYVSHLDSLDQLASLITTTRWSSETQMKKQLQHIRQEMNQEIQKQEEENTTNEKNTTPKNTKTLIRPNSLNDIYHIRDANKQQDYIVHKDKVYHKEDGTYYCSLEQLISPKNKNLIEVQEVEMDDTTYSMDIIGNIYSTTHSHPKTVDKSIYGIWIGYLDSDDTFLSLPTIN